MKTLKGKTKVGKILDSVFEIAPIPNPIRYVRERQEQRLLKQVASSSLVKREAESLGINVNDLIEEGPSWLGPVVALAISAAAIYAFLTGLITIQDLVELIK